MEKRFKRWKLEKISLGFRTNTAAHALLVAAALDALVGRAAEDGGRDPRRQEPHAEGLRGEDEHLGRLLAQVLRK